MKNNYRKLQILMKGLDEIVKVQEIHNLTEEELKGYFQRLLKVLYYENYIPRQDTEILSIPSITLTQREDLNYDALNVLKIGFGELIGMQGRRDLSEGEMKKYFKMIIDRIFYNEYTIQGNQRREILYGSNPECTELVEGPQGPEELYGSRPKGL